MALQRYIGRGQGVIYADGNRCGLAERKAHFYRSYIDFAHFFYLPDDATLVALM